MDDDGESVLLSFGSLPSGVTAGSPATATVNLADNDVPEVTLSADASAVTEGDSASFTVTASPAPGANLEVTIKVTQVGSYIDGTPPASVTIGAGQTAASVSVSTDDDSVDEAHGSIAAELRDGTGYVLGSPASGKVNVQDNDGPPPPRVSVSFGASSHTATEGGAAATVTVELSADPERTVRIPIGVTLQGGATADDYSGVPAALTFNSGDTSRQFAVTATDDTVDDDGESLRLSFGSLPYRVTAGTPAAATVDLADNDVPEVSVSFSAASYEAVEGGDAATVTVTLSADPERDVAVPLEAAPADGATDADFTGVPASVTVPSGSTSATFAVTATDDTVDDDGESVSLSFGSLPDRVTAGSPAAASVELTDNDDPRLTVSFSAASYEAVEGGAAATVTVTLSAVPEGAAVGIGFVATPRGGATADDYSGVPKFLVFSGAQTSRTFTVTATDDSAIDAGESVSLGFVLPANVRTGDWGSATVELIDNDAPEVTVSFGAASYTATEGGAEAVVTVALSADPEREVTIPVESAAQGGATPPGETGADYSEVPASVTFAVGETARRFTLAATDDNVDDDGESVSLGFGTLPAGVTAGSPATATVTLVDDDVPTWSVAIRPSMLLEAGGTATLTVSTGGTVTFAEDRTIALTASGTATAGTDYTLSAGGQPLPSPYAVTLAAGDTSATATLTGVADSVADSGETVTLAASLDATALGTATTTIVEGVCGRTDEVRDAIVAALGSGTACADVTAAQLAGLASLSVTSASLTGLKAGDFDGLTGLSSLDLSSNELAALPGALFADLGALTVLDLSHNRLGSLPANAFRGLGALTALRLENVRLDSLPASVFAGLTALRELNLRKNRLAGLPASVFAGLGALTELNLGSNSLSALPGGLLSGLTSLDKLFLEANSLSGLPDGLFEGLGGLTVLRLESNSVGTLSLTVSLEKVGDDGFRAVVPAGAPFALSLPVGVSSAGTISGGANSTTIAAGAVRGDALTVGRVAGTTAAVTADLGTLPGLPGEHRGYKPVKSADLPLEILAEVTAGTAAGPTVSLSVADASAREGADATIDFLVTLDAAAVGEVTVSYRTLDGTATAGEDYRSSSGTLTFPVSATARTVSVPLLDDAVDEAEERFALELSDASGARLARARAQGTIANSDPLPRAWLVRFGRGVASHVADGIGERLARPDAPAPRVALGGLGPVSGAHPSFPGAGIAVRPEDPRRSFDAGWGGGLAGAAAFPDRSPLDVLAGGSFVAPLGKADPSGAGWTWWGRGAASRFDGREDELSLDGELRTYLLGADTGRGRWLAGVALSRSTGGGGYDAAAAAGSQRGELDSVLTGIHPYARVAIGERWSAWGTLGYGRGELTLERAGSDRWTVDSSMRMGAAGARGVLRPASIGGAAEWALRADLLWTDIASDGLETTGGRMAGASGATGRLRLMLEGSRRFALGNGRSLTPNLELGVRGDGGDADTGAGLELGGGLAFAAPERGLSVELRARGLLAHRRADYREWGASAAVRFDPGIAGKGLRFTLAPSWGAPSSTAQRLWSQPAAHGLVARRDFVAEGRLDAEMGYAMAGPRGVGLQTPYAAWSRAAAGERTLRLGWRLVMTPLRRLDLEAAHRAAASGGPAENTVLLRIALRW